MGFAEDLDRHLAAIRRRDLDALEATLDPDDVVLVAADGEVATGRDEFLRRHAAWFASDGWSLDARPVHRFEGSDLAVCVLALRYRDRPAGAPPIDEPSVLTLVFRRRGDRWLMVHDQNTPVRRAAEPSDAAGGDPGQARR